MNHYYVDKTIGRGPARMTLLLQLLAILYQY